ncbi:relaxase/mobilization nuclease domain-containing protein (plasmid) [Pseudomonas yamanorum]|nr:relaxase/mobilization nuclease domain-containing protein [Pseudomonas yamanorum]
MNVIIPPKLRNKSTSFVKLVGYLTQREDKPSGKDVLTDTPKVSRSESNQAVFDRLVDYIDREGIEDAPVRVLETFSDGRQRVQVGDVACETNAFSYETAAAEMNMVAAQNRHVKDPVYHFIISWPESDKPTDGQIFGSAQYSLEALGLKGHQYVAAIHRDTDNVHVHIAANRVNPVDYKASNMWGDVDTLQKSMRVLERHYGFKQDNGTWQMNPDNQLVRAPFHYLSAPQGAAKREIFSNTESLYHYAIEKVRVKVNEAMQNKEASWKYLHLLLHANGLGLREQGGGLVVYDYQRPSEAVLKASSVHPSLTKARLEPSYGAYEGPPPFVSDDPYNPWEEGIFSEYQPLYEARDKGVRAERREQRADAREDLKMRYQAYRSTWNKPDLDVKGRYQIVAARYQAMKGDVKRSYNDPLLRKLMYRVAEFERMKAMAELRIELRQERQVLSDKGLLRPLTYRRWVELEALDGDPAAVSQLRGFAHRETRKKRALEQQQGNFILAGKADDTHVGDPATHTSRLYRDGTIEYLRDGVAGVVDHGGWVEIKPGFADYDDSANYRLAVNLVSIKSGERGEVVGDDEFVDRVLEMACDFKHTNDQYYEFPVTDPGQLAWYESIERSYRRKSGYEQPVQAPRYVERHDQVDEVVQPTQYPRP